MGWLSVLWPPLLLDTQTPMTEQRRRINVTACPRGHVHVEIDLDMTELVTILGVEGKVRTDLMMDPRDALDLGKALHEESMKFVVRHVQDIIEKHMLEETETG